MATSLNFINQIKHRPWEMPNKNWQFYQEWNDVLFLHFEVDFKELKALIPRDLTLDTFNYKHYVSVVIFKMEKIRPANLPSIRLISDFYEINVHTYVKKGDKKGIYFINIEANKKLSALIAKTLSGLPYEKSEIIREPNAYININHKKDYYLDVSFKVGEKINFKSELDVWFTERYCLYLHKNDKLHRYDIHHTEWNVYQVNLLKIDIQYHINSLEIENYKLAHFHYSPGVQVISWEAEYLKE
jgi:uncharacterized protein